MENRPDWLYPRCYDVEKLANLLRDEAEQYHPSDPQHSHLAGLRLRLWEAFRLEWPGWDVYGKWLTSAQPRPGAYMERIERLRAGS